MGRTVLVTGAGSGIGRAVSRQAARSGADVVLVGRRPERLEQVADEIEKEGRVAHPVAADVGQPEEAERVVSAAMELCGGVDGLVNNAGVARFAPLEDADMRHLELMFATHVRAPLFLIRGCLPSLRERRGAVVNVSSVGGTLATPNRALYGATKAALNHLTRSLAVELAPQVRVNGVLPGPVDTPMYDDLGQSAAETQQLREHLIQATPLRRFGRPEEVATWVCRLLSEDEAGWLTGALIPVDGGRTA